MNVKVDGLEEAISELAHWDFPDPPKPPLLVDKYLVQIIDYVDDITSDVWRRAAVAGASTAIEELGKDKALGCLLLSEAGLRFEIFLLENIKMSFPITAEDIRNEFDDDALKLVASRLRALADEIEAGQ